MRQTISFLFLSFGFIILFMNCKDQGTTPPEVTTPEISGIELSSEQIIVNDSVVITATLSEVLGEEYLLKWNLSGYQTEIDSVTSSPTFSWKAPKVHGSYEHSIQIVSVTGEPISEAHLFSTEIASVPVVPVEGNKLVFSMQPEGEDRNQIFTMNVDGSALTQLTFYEEGNVSDPSWSPDGKSIIYTRFSGGWTGDPGMYLMDENGSNVRPLKIWEGPTGIHGGRTPKWSPNGVKIVYTAYLGNQEIMVYDFETDEIIRLTNHIRSDSQPTWSPDSKQLVFISGRDYNKHDSLKRNFDLYKIDIGDDNVQRLTEIGYSYNPVWRPGSKELIFRDSKILKIVNVETKGVTPVNVSFQEDLILFPKSWSLSERLVLFETQNYPLSTFHILDLETKEVTDIPLNPQEFSGMDWYQYEKE